MGVPKLLRAAAVAFRIPFCLSSLHVLRGSLDMEPVSALLLGPLTTPGLLHPKSAQLMNKIGKIRDELCMCSLHVEYVFSVFKMRLRKRTDTRIQNGWLLGRKSEYILTY